MKEKETKFNSGIATVLSLRDLLDKCNRHSQNCRIGTTEDGTIKNRPNTIELDLWRSTIRSVHKEIEAKLVTKDKEKINKIRAKFKISLYTQKVTEEGTFSEVNIKGFLERVNHFQKMEIMLREFADKKGLLNPTKDDGIDDTPEQW